MTFISTRGEGQEKTNPSTSAPGNQNFDVKPSSLVVIKLGMEQASQSSEFIQQLCQPLFCIVFTGLLETSFATKT